MEVTSPNLVPGTQACSSTDERHSDMVSVAGSIPARPTSFAPGVIGCTLGFEPGSSRLEPWGASSPDQPTPVAQWMSRRLLSGRVQVQVLPGVPERSSVMAALRTPKPPDLAQSQAPLYSTGERKKSQTERNAELCPCSSVTEHIPAKDEVPGS